MFLYRHLFFKLTEEIRRSATRRQRPDFGVASNVKNLPDKETLFLHLMHAFAENRAAAVLPHIEGSIFLREKMRQKAKLRDIVRQKQGEKARTRPPRRRPSPKPRSIKHLKMALQKQEEGLEASEREYLAKEYRDLEREVMREFYRSALGGLSQCGDVEQGLKVICDRLAKAGQSLRAPLPSLRTTQSLPELSGTKVLPGVVDQLDGPLSQRELPDETFITQLNQPEIEASPGNVETQRNGTDERLVDTKLEMTEPQVDEVGTLDENAKHRVPDSGQLADGDDREIPAIRVGTPEPVLITPPLNSASELVVAKEAVHLTSRSEIVSTDVGDDFIPDEAKWRLEQLQASIKNSVKLAPEDPSYRDWETSDKSLQYLEQRLKNFKINREPTFVRLPPLQRFQAGVCSHGDGVTLATMSRVVPSPRIVLPFVRPLTVDGTNCLLYC